MRVAYLEQRKSGKFPGEDSSIDQCTTKERAPHSEWLIRYALGSQDVQDPWALYLQRKALLKQVRKYRQEMKREPIARQYELRFPLPKS